ncbi:hypothetical protein OKJ48_30335 [Streptomyces kunmingensis]|uniref:Uncharacterized protein n=1 Tax=Streptomyces kunmingensis TaxID=68225 RepID=A0ABU6CIE4_9ACTN|nr:hypothetical protein [Streptomyces kunmingensis]MEB3964496.1 hypothetical protein [Streptomyces kunmingensis]
MGSRRRIRRLVVHDRVYGWCFAHRHDRTRGHPGCRSTLTLWRHGSRARLCLVFRPADDRVISDCFFDSGAALRMPDQVYLNLHEPGTVRALLDEALARGLFPAGPGTTEVDAWPLFDAVTEPAQGPS